MAWFRTKIGFAPKPKFALVHFRFRTDDSQGLNADAGWAGALDENVTVNAEAVFRMRIEVEEQDNVNAASIQWQLYWRKNGGPWEFVLNHGYPAALATPGLGATESAQYAQNDTTSNILAGSGKTFQAGVGTETGATGTFPNVQNEHIETEFCLRIRRQYDGGRNDAGDEFEFKLRESGTDNDLTGVSLIPKVTLAIPTGLIGGTLVESPGRVGPFKDGNGNLYYLHERAETNNIWLISKSTDGGDTWVDVDTANRPTKGDLESVDAVLENDRLYILHHQNPAVWHHIFRVSTHGTNPDTWELKDEEIENNSIPNPIPSNQFAGIVRRSDGDLIAFFVFNNGTNTQIYYRIKPNAGAWGSRIQLDSEAVNFSGVAVVRGASDKTHIVYADDAGNVYHRSLDSADTLSARESLTTTALTANSVYQPLAAPVYWDESGTEKILVSYVKAADGKVYSRIITNDGTPGTESAAASDNAVYRNGGGSHAVCYQAVNDGANVYIVYGDNTTQDIFRDVNLDEAGWGTDVELLDAKTCDNITANLFTHSAGNGGAKVLGYVYENGTDGYTGQLWYAEEAIAASPQTIACSGIASLEAFGTAKVNQSIAAAGIASAEAFGAALVNQQIRPSAIASAEAFGTAQLNQLIAPPSITSLEAFGTAKLNQLIAPSGIATEEAFGSPTLTQQIRPTGVASAEGFGNLTLVVPQFIVPSAIPSEEAFGSARVNLQLLPSAIASGEAFGTATLHQQIRPSGIASAEAFGTALVNQTIAPSGIASSETFGSPVVSIGGANQTIIASAIASAEAFGTTKLNQQIVCSGIASSETFGAALVNQQLRPTSISSLEAFGSPTLHQQIRPTGIASSETFGGALVNQQIRVSGIASAEAFGTPTVMNPQTIVVSSIGSAEAFGSHVVTVSGASLTIIPGAIASAEAFGTAALHQQIRCTGIASAEAFGTARVNLQLAPTSISSLEAFGSPTLHQQIRPSGIASAEAFGTARVNQTITPTGITSAEAFGGAALAQQIRATGIPSAEAFGATRVNQQIRTTGIGSAEAFGTAFVSVAGSQVIAPSGIPSGEAFGNTTVTFNLYTLMLRAKDDHAPALPGSDTGTISLGAS